VYVRPAYIYELSITSPDLCVLTDCCNFASQILDPAQPATVVLYVILKASM